MGLRIMLNILHGWKEFNELFAVASGACWHYHRTKWNIYSDPPGNVKFLIKNFSNISIESFPLEN